MLRRNFLSISVRYISSNCNKCKRIIFCNDCKKYISCDLCNDNLFYPKCKKSYCNNYCGGVYGVDEEIDIKPRVD
jgi:hypothetical protein